MSQAVFLNVHMSATRRLVETNQEQATQMMNSNEAMISLANSLRAKLAATKAALEKCRQETLQSVEPKIQELLQGQKQEMEKQRQEFMEKIQNEKAKQEQRVNDLQAELATKLNETKEKCAKKVQKMKQTVESRKKELEAAIQARLAQIPTKISEKQKQEQKEEDIVRQEWEKIISAKLTAEYQEKKDAARKAAKANQNQKALDIIDVLERETRVESSDLARKIEKETKEHEIAIKRLQKRLEERKLELEDLQSDESHLEIEQNISEMKRAIENCQCAQYRRELDAVFEEIAGLEEQFDQVTQAISKERKAQMDETEHLRMKLNDLDEQKSRLQAELARIAKQDEIESSQLETQLSEMETKHKEQLTAIAERVKATVAKKDQVIADLKHRAETFGLIPKKQ